jgi:hypothetical protein
VVVKSYPLSDGEGDMTTEKLVETVQKILRTGADLAFLLKLEQKELKRWWRQFGIGSIRRGGSAGEGER